MNTMVIIAFIENISILLAFIFTLYTPPPQNLISATDIKFTIGGPLAWSSNKEQMSRRNRKPSEDWSYFTVEVN